MKLQNFLVISLTLLSAMLTSADPAEAAKNGKRRQKYRTVIDNTLSSGIFPLADVFALGTVDINFTSNGSDRTLQSVLGISLPKSVPSLGIVDETSAAQANIRAEVRRGSQVISECVLEYVEIPARMRDLFEKSPGFAQMFLGNSHRYEVEVYGAEELSGGCTIPLNQLLPGDEIIIQGVTPENAVKDIAIGQLAKLKVKKTIARTKRG